MHGVIAAVPTSLDANGAPQMDMFLSHCAWVLENGCDGLNILGSTGEANSFGLKTRKEIMTEAAQTLECSRLMVGTGTPSLSDTVELTRHADDLGYSVALVLPPYYYKPVSDDGLFAWYESIHDALGDRKIAIYFYNFPQMTGLTIPVSVIKRLHKLAPSRFAGIKDSSGDLDYCREIAASLPGVAVFPSSEVSLAEADKSQFAGCISATTNQTGALCAKLWADRANPDADLVSRINAIRTAIAGQDLIPSIKFLVGLRTGNTEWEALLPPFSNLTDARKSELKTLWDQLSKN